MREKRMLALVLAFALAFTAASCARKGDGGATGGSDAPGTEDGRNDDAEKEPGTRDDRENIGGSGEPDGADEPNDAGGADNPDAPDDPGGGSGGGEEPDDGGPAIPDAPISAPHFTRDEFPRLDGSTATAPLAVAMAALMLGESEEDAEELVSFSRTANSYYNLLYGNADLLIVSEGSEEVYAERERRGFAWEQTPFAIDAFVFVVNENNPVESITVDEARRIYTGEITNWSQLGGEDEPIIPLQRDPEAGSQSLMEKLVMRGAPMMEAPTEYVASSMGGLMEAVRGYDSSAGAIGYSVYYYAEEMRAAEGLKLLKLEGVEPEPDAIRSGAYPLTNPYYVVIPASAAEGSPVRVIRDWLLGEDGQRLAAREGYVSVMDIPISPKETIPNVGTRLFDEFTDTLAPGDYGTLTPYAGRRVTDDADFASTGCVFGLMTTAGQVAVDPVYTDVWTVGDLLVLFRVEDGWQRVAAAHKSGKWCTDFDYFAASIGEQGIILYREGEISLLRRDGSDAGTYTAEDLGVTEEDLQVMSMGPIEGGGGDWLDDKISISMGKNVFYYDLTEKKTGTVDSYEAWEALRPPYVSEEPVIEGAYYIHDSALGDDAPAILELDRWNGDAYDRSWYYEDGALIPVLSGDTRNVNLTNGLIGEIGVSTATYYRLDTLEVVFRTYLGSGGD